MGSLDDLEAIARLPARKKDDASMARARERGHSRGGRTSQEQIRQSKVTITLPRAPWEKDGADA
jgi:hypothetical protein